jgi:SpoVK/Ycf46/Vps4 family AAA+-type ATPase
MARDENFDVAPNVAVAISAVARGGGYKQAKALWRQIKTTQFARLQANQSGVDTHQSGKITLADVHGAKMPVERLPVDELHALIGQQPAKDELLNVLGEVKLAGAFAREGVGGKRPRLNLLFAGNPGTGKTTFAELFIEELHRIGYLKNGKLVKAKIQDLLDGGHPEEAVKRLFEANRGGAIFIDELHQLRDTELGKRAFRSIIPYLGSEEYRDTVFIGAGYDDELRKLVELDPGGERRFTKVPFRDNSPEELGRIFDKQVNDRHLIVSPQARAEAINRLDAQRRQMKHFGNAGSVETIIEEAQKKRTRRLSSLDHDKLARDQLVRLLPEDFVQGTEVTPAQVWREIDALEGLPKVKAKLKEIASLVEFAKETGEDPFKYFDPYFVIEGPQGSGKNTLARIVARFAAAYHLTGSPELVEQQAAGLQGRFLGQTAGDVAELFDRAWGRTLVIRKAGGLAAAAGEYKTEAVKEMLSQMGTKRGRFVMVVMDDKAGVHDFLSLDNELASAFGNRLTTAPLTADDATRVLVKQLDAEGFDTSHVRDEIKHDMKHAAANSSWASGHDVRKLMGLIVRKQAQTYMQSARRGAPKRILGAAVTDAFATLSEEAHAPVARKPLERGVHRYATDLARAMKIGQKEELEVEAHLDDGDHELLHALALIDGEFKDQFNGDPQEQVRQEADPQSAYVERIAQAAQMKPRLIVERLKKMKEKIKRLITDEKLVQHFQYHCPYCGGVDSPACAYRNYPLEWRVEHSLKKPWTESIRTNRVVEEERETEHVVREEL